MSGSLPFIGSAAGGTLDEVSHLEGKDSAKSHSCPVKLSCWRTMLGTVECAQSRSDIRELVKLVKDAAARYQVSQSDERSDSVRNPMKILDSVRSLFSDRVTILQGDPEVQASRSCRTVLEVPM